MKKDGWYHFAQDSRRWKALMEELSRSDDEKKIGSEYAVSLVVVDADGYASLLSTQTEMEQYADRLILNKAGKP